MNKFAFTTLIMLLSIPVLAQYTWIETEFSTKLAKKLEISVSPEVRFKESLELKEYFIQPALEYKFHKYFRLAAGYRFGYNINKKDEHEAFGRFHIDAKTGYKWNGFHTKFRLRFSNEDDFSDDDEETTNFLRYKLGIEYNIKKADLEPYLSYEWYQDMDKNKLTKAHFEGGLMYKINKHHKIGAYYRANFYADSDKDTKNILGISYKFDL